MTPPWKGIDLSVKADKQMDDSYGWIPNPKTYPASLGI